MTTEDTEAVNDPNHHMNAALEAVAKLARKLKAERDEAREYVDRYRESLDLTPMSWEAAE